MRSHSTANVLGETLTAWFQAMTHNTSVEEYEMGVASEWVVTDRLNAESKRNFSSWAEFYGPRYLHEDMFSLTEQYNMSDRVFDENAFNVKFPECYLTKNCTHRRSLWDPEDIVILTDGLCASACALFVEMMQQAQVRTIVVGGRPETGPMQAVSGSRGAASYSSDALDYDLDLANWTNPAAASLLPQHRDKGMVIWNAGFTLRDQMRQNSTIPNQFRYIAADCRIYWTLDNFFNYTRLWLDTYNAMYTDASLCVAGSTNVTSPPANEAASRKRSISTRDQHRGLSDYIKQGIAFLDDPTTGIRDGPHAGPHDPPILCSTFNDGQRELSSDQSQCSRIGAWCVPTPVRCMTCDDSEDVCDEVVDYHSTTTYVFLCEKPCIQNAPNGGGTNCKDYEYCKGGSLQAHGGYHSIQQDDYSIQHHHGVCQPQRIGNGLTTCTNIRRAAAEDKHKKELIKLIKHGTGDFQLD